MAKIFVTGGSGMIGCAVVNQLRALEQDVVVFDFWNPNIPGVTFVEGSILDQNVLNQAMQGCDYVIHLAAILGVANSTKNPLDCLNVNISGTSNVLEACVKNKIKRIVFSSSSEVYGEANVTPIPEDATKQPKSEYGISKLVGEEYVKAFYMRHGLDFNIVRFFSIYGPKQASNFVMSAFVNKVACQQPLFLYGDGQQVRSFCYVEDAARGAITALFSAVSKDVFNIGNDKTQTTMLDLAKLVIKISGRDPGIKLVPFENSDRTKDREIFIRLPNTAKAKDLLHFEAQIGLEEGITQMVEAMIRRSSCLLATG